MPAYSLVRACMLDSKGVAWHQAPGWFQLKCKINCFEEKIWSLNCLCVFLGFFYWLPLKLYIILINIVLKGFWYPALYSDWYPMLLFESSVSSAFWNVLSYSVIRAYSVSDFEKCTTLFCYLELRSTSMRPRKYNDILVNVCHKIYLKNIVFKRPNNLSRPQCVKCIFHHC